MFFLPIPICEFQFPKLKISKKIRFLVFSEALHERFEAESEEVRRERGDEWGLTAETLWGGRSPPSAKGLSSQKGKTWSWKLTLRFLTILLFSF